MDMNARFVVKQINGMPTVPPSLDSRNGDWITSDIYEGEACQDLDTGLMYTRSYAGITTIDGGATKKTLKVLATQTALLAPVLTILQNDFGVVPTASWVGNGSYTLNLTGGFFTSKTSIITGGVNTTTASFFNAYRSTTSIIVISTRDLAGVGTNSLLTESTILIEVYD